MTYSELADFIQRRMRMSHIYQPVMLMALLENEGNCSIEDIARSILAHDQSQIEYYEEITKQMPGSVLGHHGIVQREKDSYILNGFNRLTSDQVKTLIELCRAKLNEYIAKRGERIWQHRKLSSGLISGSLKYQVLTRAKTRCEACGVSNEEKALEVDHIVPRNKGGTDDLSNLQALCYSCNSMKQDKDATDFHQVRESYGSREAGCPFCDIPGKGVLVENELAFVMYDAFPVTDLHVLIIPKRHVPDFFSLYAPEVNAITALIKDARVLLEKKDKTISGFNIGINNGESSGQTIFHCHVHLIPRRPEDVENPRGGVRNVIPGKGPY